MNPEPGTIPVACCPRSRVVQARNITAIVHQGHLLGQQELEKNDPRRRLVPERYDVVEYCGNPVCEKVHRAVKHQEEA